MRYFEKDEDSNIIYEDPKKIEGTKFVIRILIFFKQLMEDLRIEQKNIKLITKRSFSIGFYEALEKLGAKIKYSNYPSSTYYKE